jgi:hypothetical protein
MDRSDLLLERQTDPRGARTRYWPHVEKIMMYEVGLNKTRSCCYQLGYCNVNLLAAH